MSKVIGANAPLYLAFAVGGVTLITAFILFYADGNSVDTVCQELERDDWCFESSGGLVVVSYTSVPYPGSAIFGVGMSMTALALLLVSWNIFWAQDMDIMKQLRDEEKATETADCCFCSTSSFGSKVVYHNRAQAVMGCIASVALVILAVVSMRVNKPVHLDAAIVFFVAAFLQYCANFCLQCILTQTTPWSQITGSNIAPRSLKFKRWVIRLSVAFALIAFVIFICLAVAGAETRRWYVPITQWCAILVVALGYATYAVDITMACEAITDDSDDSPPIRYSEDVQTKMPPLVQIPDSTGSAISNEAPAGNVSPSQSHVAHNGVSGPMEVEACGGCGCGTGSQL